MSKKLARLPKSYEEEQIAFELVPAVLVAHGFRSVSIRKRGQVKLVDASAGSGQRLCFWLKQAWGGERHHYSGVQFGLIPGRLNLDISDERFEHIVDKRVGNVRELGATHALFIQLQNGLIANWVALTIDDVSVAYHRQMAGWPRRARNGMAPTLWFEDERVIDGADCVQPVKDVEVSLQALASIAGVEDVGRKNDGESGLASKKITAEVERRMKQAAFRLKLGKHYGWRCAVSGASIKAALEAAHLPGRNWRFDNAVTDGVLLRADLHRLLDAGLARFEENRFMLDTAAQVGEYALLHGALLRQEAFNTELAMRVTSDQ